MTQAPPAQQGNGSQATGAMAGWYVLSKDFHIYT